MAYRVSRARAVTKDLAHIDDHLVESYCDLGDGITDAPDRADSRVRTIEEAMMRLGAVPDQGTLCDNVMPRLRRVTKDKAILYFIADDDLAEIRVLAVFFIGQDHLRHIVERLDSRRAYAGEVARWGIGLAVVARAGFGLWLTRLLIERQARRGA